MLAQLWKAATSLRRNVGFGLETASRPHSAPAQLRGTQSLLGDTTGQENLGAWVPCGWAICSGDV